MEVNEEFILIQLRNGSEASFKYLFEKYYVKLCKISMMYVGDSFAAENIVSDLFFHIWEHHHELDISTSISSYLFRSIKNRSLNYLQKASVVRELSYDNLNQSTELANLTAEELPLEQLESKELCGKINTAINSLSKECRSVFVLSRFESLSYKEISEHLNISINTVRYHIKNALFKLRIDLKEYLTIIIVLIQLTS